MQLGTFSGDDGRSHGDPSNHKEHQNQGEPVSKITPKLLVKKELLGNILVNREGLLGRLI